MNAGETAKNLRRFSELLDNKMDGIYEHRLMARTLKVTEEAGELAAALIRHQSKNILKEDGYVSEAEVKSHIMSLAITVLALYELFDRHGEHVLDDLEVHAHSTLAWAKQQVGE